MSQRDLSEVSTAHSGGKHKRPLWNLPPGRAHTHTHTHTVLSLRLHHCWNAEFIGRGFPRAPRRCRCSIHRCRLVVASLDLHLPNLVTVWHCSESSGGQPHQHVLQHTHTHTRTHAHFTFLRRALGPLCVQWIGGTNAAVQAITSHLKAMSGLYRKTETSHWPSPHPTTERNPHTGCLKNVFSSSTGPTEY
jgi:hypothetical protein